MCRRIAKRSTQGFTLIELLIVIAIIALLIALLLSVLGRVREKSRMTQCSNNLRQIGSGLQLYHESRGSFPAGQEHKTTLDLDTSWLTRLLIMMDEENLYNKYDFTQRWDIGTNLALSNTNVASYRCPSTPDMVDGQGDYAGIDGTLLTGLVVGDAYNESYGSGVLIPTDATALPKNRPVSYAMIRDGKSYTIMVGEDGGRNASQPGAKWADGNQIIGVDKRINETNDNELASEHPGGCHLLFVGGTVLFASDSVDPVVLGRLSTRDGGESVSVDDFR